jgi:hypothetical protein
LRGKRPISEEKQFMVGVNIFLLGFLFEKNTDET